jgi:hypothetical protein
MFTRFNLMMLLSTILMIAASAMGASACEHMSPPVLSTDHVQASPPETLSTTNAIRKDTAEFARSDSHDVDGCLPQCCRTNVCCHLIVTSPLPGCLSDCGEHVVASLSTDGALRSTQPDVPPPKTV